MNKQKIREKILASKKHTQDISLGILPILLELIESKRPQIVHVYLPIKEKKEISTWPFIEEIFNSHPDIEMYVPYFSKLNRELKAVKLENDSELEEVYASIPQPVNAKFLKDFKEIDMIVIPVLAFDNNGNRVGTGSGYYDKLIPMLGKDCQRVGLAYDSGFISEGIDIEPHDQKLDCVITEKQIYLF